MRSVSHSAVTQIRTSTRVASADHFTTQVGGGGGADLSVVAHHDAERAGAAADGLASNWRISYEKHAAAGEDEGEAMANASRALIEHSAARTAETETAEAFNEETQRQADFARRSGIDVVLVWSAYLDDRTCDECADMDGVRDPDEPPPLHCRCRCLLCPE